MDTLEYIVKILNRYTRATLFSRTHYTELQKAITYAVSVSARINRLINVWNVLLNITSTSDEWDSINSAHTLETSWFRLYNKTSNFII